MRIQDDDRGVWLMLPAIEDSWRIFAAEADRGGLIVVLMEHAGGEPAGFCGNGVHDWVAHCAVQTVTLVQLVAFTGVVTLVKDTLRAEHEPARIGVGISPKRSGLLARGSSAPAQLRGADSVRCRTLVTLWLISGTGGDGAVTETVTLPELRRGLFHESASWS